MKGWGRWVALSVWSTATFGVGFVLGLETTPEQWVWELSYNPLTPALIAMLFSVAIWWIDRSKTKDD